MRIRTLTLGLLALAVATACAPAEEEGAATTDETTAEQPRPEEKASAEQAIRDMAEEYGAAVAAGDFERFLTFFTEDVVIYPPGEPAVVGKQEFREWSKPLFDNLDMEETISYEDLKVAGDWAVGPYRYVFTTTPKEAKEDDETVTEEGKGIVVLRRQPDESWKWSHVAWNRNEPPPREP